ncbi:Sec-independent protein translocase protein TatB [Luteimonas sp. e5]
MFEISFPELVILGVVALLVLGPERLPRAARFAGLWVRRARAHWHTVKSEFERELADEDLRRSLEQARAAVDEAGEAMREGIAGMEDAAREAKATLKADDGAASAEAARTDATAPDAQHDRSDERA